jgi:hypothetical protein
MFADAQSNRSPSKLWRFVFVCSFIFWILGFLIWLLVLPFLFFGMLTPTGAVVSGFWVFITAYIVGGPVIVYCLIRAFIYREQSPNRALVSLILPFVYFFVLFGTMSLLTTFVPALQ